LQSFFFMLKIKNSQKRRNINVSKSLITCYLSQTSSIFYIFRSLSTCCKTLLAGFYFFVNFIDNSVNNLILTQ
ncbi:hypothetical protein EI994_10305, partial [Streptococcus suis]